MSLGANNVCIFPPVRGSWCGPQASFWSLSCLKPAFPRAEKAPETHTLRSHQAGAGRAPGGPFASSDLSTDLQGSGATQCRAHPRGQTGPLCPTEWPDSPLQHPVTLTPGSSGAVSLVARRHQDTLKILLVPSPENTLPSSEEPYSLKSLPKPTEECFRL